MAEVSDLNRQIAEQLGWTNIHEKTYWSEDYDGEGWVTILVGNPPGREDDRPLPDCEHDLNATLAALPKRILSFTVRPYLKPYSATIEVERDNEMYSDSVIIDEYTSIGETVQEAAARALLALLEAQEEVKL